MDQMENQQPEVYRSSGTFEPLEPIAVRKFAGFWIRFVAAILDGLVLQALTLILNFLFAGDWRDVPFWLELVETLIGFAYYIILTARGGQTLGKMICGIQVIRQSGEPLSYGRAFLREIIGKFISGIILLIGYIMAGLNKEKKALHDMLADTYVVYKK